VDERERRRDGFDPARVLPRQIVRRITGRAEQAKPFGRQVRE
jgi:hypothetical protein